MEKQCQDVDAVRFLLGLKLEFESVCAQILGGSNLPSLLEVFSRIQRANQQRKVVSRSKKHLF
jgi:hypothetical protein